MITETYRPGIGFLYRTDPRTKLVLLVFFVLFFIIASSPGVQAAVLVLLLLVCGRALGFRHMLDPLRSILPILILTAVLTPPFNRTGEALLSAGETVIITVDGLRLAGLLLLRFSGITSAFYMFFSSTKTNPMIMALRAFGLPFRASLAVTISLRYIPDMFSTYERITDAHRLRTAGTEAAAQKGFRHRFRNLFPVLTSVLIHAVKGIPALAMALDSKGFGRSNPRTFCRKLKPWRRIAAELTAAVLFCAILTVAAVLF